MGIILSFDGQKIVKRGGHDTWNDDALLIGEIMQRAPNMDPKDYHDAFVALRMEYGEEALRAVQSGHVKFELVTARDAKEPLPPKGE